ncbi:GNAT family N-acetyltransferase [Ornithinicoccus halotolerans]|uniref:GNAT family N-acetyltransferase n=1 Tax=Ornithinicoccus halotolerans TaxID=1748220 RepID=UPI001E5294AA|nr:GNAT family N-acetyltransferase [Ornithinicoccus halotolerans]
MSALTDFAWTLPDLHRVEVYIEPWNVASQKDCHDSRLPAQGNAQKPLGDW